MKKSELKDMIREEILKEGEIEKIQAEIHKSYINNFYEFSKTIKKDMSVIQKKYKIDDNDEMQELIYDTLDGYKIDKKFEKYLIPIMGK